MKLDKGKPSTKNVSSNSDPSIEQGTLSAMSML